MTVGEVNPAPGAAGVRGEGPIQAPNRRYNRELEMSLDVAQLETHRRPIAAWNPYLDTERAVSAVRLARSRFSPRKKRSLA